MLFAEIKLHGLATDDGRRMRVADGSLGLH